MPRSIKTRARSMPICAEHAERLATAYEHSGCRLRWDVSEGSSECAACRVGSNRSRLLLVTSQHGSGSAMQEKPNTGTASQTSPNRRNSLSPPASHAIRRISGDEPGRVPSHSSAKMNGRRGHRWPSGLEVGNWRASQTLSVPITSVTVYTEDMGNTLASQGFGVHSRGLRGTAPSCIEALRPELRRTTA